MNRLLLGLSLTFGFATLFVGCDFLGKAQGVLEVANEFGQHLQKDMQSKLTAEKIDKVVKITPELVEFSKTAKHKWQPNPGAGDVEQLSAGLGALSEYLAFFKARDTRLSEYFVDVMKIHDARMQVVYGEAREKAVERLTKEKAELEANSELAAEQKATAIKQCEEALATLEQARLAIEAKNLPAEATQKKQPPYTLTPEEITLVEERLAQIEAAFKQAGYTKGGDDTAAVEVTTTSTGDAASGN